MADESVGSDGISKISDILSGSLNGKRARVRGWAYRARASNNLAFIVIRDSSGIIQCAFKKDSAPADVFDKAKGCARGFPRARRVRANLRQDRRHLPGRGIPNCKGPVNGVPA
ncbi:MAG TPA: OB-fold nucleic acid binding domain-containing protein [Candidatus Micrarchaeota archaeon]|nr:OB-fold nucleic acid binding domain-containing protein [Candidatus Micrarchaeota archaeon]